MIDEQYTLADFGGVVPFQPTLATAIAAAALPLLVGFYQLGNDVFLTLDSPVRLTPAQKATLDAVVAAHNAPADLLQATKDAYTAMIDNHAGVLLQVAGLTPLQVQLDRDAVKANVAAAVDEGTARAITEAYIREDIP